MIYHYSNILKQAKQVELGDKMDLASYLLKPVQRMGKYALLLQQLMKASRQDVPDLRDAEKMVRFQLRHGNDLLAMDSLRDCDVSCSVSFMSFSILFSCVSLSLRLLLYPCMRILEAYMKNNTLSFKMEHNFHTDIYQMCTNCDEELLFPKIHCSKSQCSHNINKDPNFQRELLLQ